VIGGLVMEEDLERVIAAVNVELAASNWPQVVELTAVLYEQAVLAGEATLAELVQDLHWIAQDALLHPVEVAALLAGVAHE
jgi:hypothetical protein